MCVWDCQGEEIRGQKLINSIFEIQCMKHLLHVLVIVIKCFFSDLVEKYLLYPSRHVTDDPTQSHSLYCFLVVWKGP